MTATRNAIATPGAHAVLLAQLGQAFDQRAWHGTNLWGSVRAMDEADAVWRPGPDRHNAWELVVHAAYWKYRVHRLVTSAPPRSFGPRGSNFFPRPDVEGVASWDEDRDLLRSWHERLLGAVARVEPSRLGERVGSNGYTVQDLILGAASHDLYHAGQIQLLKKLRGSAAP